MLKSTLQYINISKLKPQLLNFSYKGFMLITILLVASNPAFATSYGYFENSTGGNYTISMNSSVSPITVTTDSQSYNDGDKIVISGTTRDYLENTPITVIIRNPVGNIVMLAQVPLETDKAYSTTVKAGGALWQVAGTYEVDVTFGTGDRSAKITFQFTGSRTAPSLPNSIPAEGTNFTVTYSITNGKILGIKTDSQSKSILVAIQTTGDGVLTVTLPRALIDAKAANHDDQYYVLLDGQEADFDESSTTSTARSLSIPFTDGTEEIEIIGTQVIPEFGPIFGLILVITLIAIIITSAKSGLRFKSRNL
jgi:hypothetical protein